MAAIELPDELAQRLRDAAAEDGVSIDEWVTVALSKVELERADPRERLRRLSGVRVPDRWPPDYADVKPVRVEGEPVSEQIIQARR